MCTIAEDGVCGAGFADSEDLKGGLIVEPSLLEADSSLWGADSSRLAGVDGGELV